MGTIPLAYSSRACERTPHLALEGWRPPGARLSHRAASQVVPPRPRSQRRHPRLAAAAPRRHHGAFQTAPRLPRSAGGERCPGPAPPADRPTLSRGPYLLRSAGPPAGRGRGQGAAAALAARLPPPAAARQRPPHAPGRRVANGRAQRPPRARGPSPSLPPSLRGRRPPAAAPTGGRAGPPRGSAVGACPHRDAAGGGWAAASAGPRGWGRRPAPRLGLSRSAQPCGEAAAEVSVDSWAPTSRTGEPERRTAGNLEEVKNPA